MSLTMRHMEFLANQGLYQFRKLWDSERGSSRISRVEQIPTLRSRYHSTSIPVFDSPTSGLITSTNTRATHDIDDDDIDDDDNTIII